MDGFLTSSFMKEFPNRLKQSLFNEVTTYYDLFLAIKSRRFVAGTEGSVFVTILETLKEEDSELYNAFISLENAGKLQPKKVDEDIPDYFKKIRIRKSTLKKIGTAFSEPVDLVCHDDVGSKRWKEEIIKSGQKPLVDNEDLTSGNVAYLFQEKSFPLNRGDTFNWSRFLVNFVYPFKRIRILDPFLYTNIRSSDLNNILKTLIRDSDSEYLSIEIISDLSADRKRKSEEVLGHLKSALGATPYLKRMLKLYDQKGSASNVFHKRVIWTDFWVIHPERGFDFLKLETGQGKVTRENTIFLTGKYSSDHSLWHQIDNNWETYLKHSKDVS